MQLQKENQELEWIKEYRKFLSISAIEFEIKCPPGTIKQWLNGKRDLPPRWETLLVLFVIDMKKSGYNKES